MDPYEKFGMAAQDMYAETRPVTGSVVAVMDFRLDGRIFDLIESRTRVLNRGSIHEVILTQEENPQPGSSSKGATYIGFLEIEAGGLILRGDTLSIAGQEIGTIAGFDQTHEPNHMNIICNGDANQTGSQFGISVNDEFIIE